MQFVKKMATQLDDDYEKLKGIKAEGVAKKTAYDEAVALKATSEAVVYTEKLNQKKVSDGMSETRPRIANAALPLLPFLRLSAPAKEPPLFADLFPRTLLTSILAPPRRLSPTSARRRRGSASPSQIPSSSSPSKTSPARRRSRKLARRLHRTRRTSAHSVSAA